MHLPKIILSVGLSAVLGFQSGIPSASAQRRSSLLLQDALPQLPSSSLAELSPARPGSELPPPRQQAGSLSLVAALRLCFANSQIARVSDGGTISADSSTAYDIEVSRQRVIAALADFDTSFGADFYTSSFNKPPNAFFGPGLSEPILRDESNLNLGLNKRLLTGAQTAITFNPDPAYLFIPTGVSGSSFNPTYVGELQFSATQPLLRGRGRAVNRAPIQIQQIRTDQSAWEFKKAMMAAARSVVEAYWDLHAARIELSSIEQIIPLLQEVVRLQEESFKAEWVIQADVAKAYAQLYDFRQRRMAAESRVVQAELRLRNLLVLPPEDGWAIIPNSEPNAVPLLIDPTSAAHVAVRNHPDVVRVRLDTKIRELELLVAKNGRLPSLDIRGLYRMNGVGEDVSSTLRQLITAEYGDWLAGLSFAVPLGNRRATANLKAAELQLARANGLVQQEIATVVYQVRDDIRDIDYAYREYAEADRKRQAASEWLSGARLRYENPRPGSEPNWLLQSLNEYLFALRFYTEATAETAKILARYNTSLIELEETKGTLLEFLNFELARDPCRQSDFLLLNPGLE